MMTNEQLIEHFSASLENERFRLGLSQLEMAKALDLSLSSYKRFVSRETHRVDAHTVYRLSQLTGKTFLELCGEPHPLHETYALLRKVSEPQLRFLHSMIAFEAEFVEHLQKQPDSGSPDDYTTLLSPCGMMCDGMICDAFSYDKIRVDTYRELFKERIDCALRVTGDSFAPFYYTDDILLISRSPVRDGDVGVFVNKLTGLLYIRRLHRMEPLRLEPLTYHGQPILIGSDADFLSHWIEFGHVLTKIRI